MDFVRGLGKPFDYGMDQWNDFHNGDALKNSTFSQSNNAN
jgi:hypothetical protein